MDQAQAGRAGRRLLGNRRRRAGLEDRPQPDRRRRRSAFPTTGSRWTTRTPTRRRSAPARSPRAARSSAATPCGSRPSGCGSAILDIASKELEIDAAGPDDRGRRGVAKGAPQKSIGVADVAGAATYNYGELISGSSTALKPYATVDDTNGQVEIEPHSAISYAACVAEVEVDDETGEVVVEKLVQVYDVGRAINPTLLEGQIEGGAIMGLGLGLLEESYPYYPSPEHRGGEFGSYLGPALHDLPELDNVDPREPVGRRALRRQGDRRDGEQRAAAGDRQRDLRRGRRVGDRDAGHAGARARRDPRRSASRGATASASSSTSTSP